MGQAKPIRILSVEDHPVFREGLSTIIASQQDMLLVGRVECVEAIAEFRRHRPDMTLMDIRLPGTSGTDSLSQFAVSFRTARIIMLTTRLRWRHPARTASRGLGLRLEEHADRQVSAVIRSVLAGRRHVSPRVAARLAEHLGDDDLLLGSWMYSDSFEMAIATSRLPITCRFRRTRLTSTSRTWWINFMLTIALMRSPSRSDAACFSSDFRPSN